MLAEESVYMPEDGLDAEPRLTVLEVIIQGVFLLPRAQDDLEVQSLCHCDYKVRK